MGWLRSREAVRVGRRESLAGVPRLCAGVRVEPAGGVTVLKTLVPRPAGFLGRFAPPRSERRYELDEFGAFIIEQLPRGLTVLDLVHAFERRFGLSHRESELGVVAFLKMLMKRNLLAVGVAAESPAVARDGAAHG